MTEHGSTHRASPAAKWVIAVAVACGGCGSETVKDPRPVVVVVSGDTAGWIVPCGCASNQSGGLPRRGTFVRQLRKKAHVILADAGGAPGGTAPYDRVKFEAVLQGEKAMDVAAHNIGGLEAALGPKYLRDVARRLDVPLISANLCDIDGRLVAEPLQIVEAAGQRVALIGVLDEQYATEKTTILPPQQAILDVLESAAGQYDAVVVLAYLEEEALRQLAEVLPEVDVVAGGPTGQPVKPEPVGAVLLASATHQGKFLARFDAPTAGDSRQGDSRQWTGRIIELDKHYADDADQTANLKRFYATLARRDFKPEDTSQFESLSGDLRAGFGVAGTERCRECHEKESHTWDDSPHAHAWASLQKKGAHVDPDCQRCHTTGYGLPGGFVSAKRSAAMVQVGCESCHGPSQAHADDDEIQTAYYARAADRCTGCHDRENSPEFEFDPYWAKIRHGKSSDADSEEVPR
ncbi:MAG: hypothetical protein HQ567_35600 [Candidatus Nealsonbacteria bacterium]|nr:hypothetical protein [Candidatus Nealsonbacteria bacterium]